MATFVTQARFTKDGLNAMIAAPQDRAEVVGRLIAQVGGKVTACYLTSGDYDILLIFEAPSYEDTVPALVAAAESGIADLKTVTALTSSEMKSAFVKAGPIAASYRSAAARPAAPPSAETQPHLSNSDFQREGGGAQEAQDEVKAARAVLDAEKRAVDDIREGRPAPYYFAPGEARSQLPTTLRSSKSAGTTKSKK